MPGRVELTVFDTDGGTPWHERSVEPIEGDIGGVAVWVSHDDALRTSQLYTLGEHPPFLQPVDDPDTSWPSSAVVDGTNIFLRDGARSIHIDASDPRAPRFVGGGPHHGDDVNAIEEVAPGQHVIHAASGLVFELGALAMVRWWPIDELEIAGRSFDGAQRAHDAARHTITLPSSMEAAWRVHIAGPHLYASTWSREGTLPSRLTRWRAQDFFAPETLAPDLERVIPSLPRLDVIARIHDARSIAFATNDEEGASIHWLSLDDGALSTHRVPGWEIFDLAVHGEKVMAIGTRRLGASSSRDALVISLVERGGHLEEAGMLSWIHERYGGDRQALAFDGRVFYARFGEGTPDLEGPVVLGFLFDDLDAPRAAYPTPGPRATSFVRGEFGWVMAYANGLHLLAPLCE